jgi:hypothetical protein
MFRRSPEILDDYIACGGEARQDLARILGGGGTIYTPATGYRAFTGRDVYSEVEILRNIAFLYEIVLVE